MTDEATDEVTGENNEAGVVKTQGRGKPKKAWKVDTVLKVCGIVSFILAGIWGHRWLSLIEGFQRVAVKHNATKAAICFLAGVLFCALLAVRSCEGNKRRVLMVLTVLLIALVVMGGIFYLISGIGF